MSVVLIRPISDAKVKEIHDVDKIVSAFPRGKFDIDFVHVLEVDYENDVWTAEGGFVAKDCPPATFTAKVDREGNISSVT